MIFEGCFEAASALLTLQPLALTQSRSRLNLLLPEGIVRFLQILLVQRVVETGLHAHGLPPLLEVLLRLDRLLPQHLALRRCVDHRVAAIGELELLCAGGISLVIFWGKIFLRCAFIQILWLSHPGSEC